MLFTLLIFAEVPFNRPNADQKRPSVPKRDEKPVMGLKSNKNFIHTNAVENIMSVAKKPQPKYVDTPGGTTNNLDVSSFVIGEVLY